MNNLESDDETGDTPLVSPFPHSDNDSDDGEVLNELTKKFTAYLDPFLPMNIILRKAYNTIMVKGLQGTRKNLVAVIKDVYVFVGNFTYITDFVVLEDIREFIISNMAENVETASRFTRDAVTMTPVTGQDFPEGVKRPVVFVFDYMLYLMRRSLEVLRKFHWTILG
ncbi:hypothetical protein Tco_0173527 [Tanacetum coccineum]